MSVYESVLADLCARFVINSPQESFQSWERLLFEVTSTSNSGLIDLFAANTAAGGARMVVLYRFSYSAAPKAGGMRPQSLTVPLVIFSQPQHAASQKHFEGVHPRLVCSSSRTSLLSRKLLTHSQCELLAPYVHNVDAIYATFLKYPPFSPRALHLALTSYFPVTN